ncbi:MAG: lipid A deacylase LpxR family protein [Gemmatimonadota bacterium]
MREVTELGGGCAGGARRRLVFGALLALGGMSATGSAQQPTAGERVEAEAAPAAARSSPWLPRLRLDNDAYNFWIHPGKRTDEQYSDGVTFSLETLRAPWWGGGLGGGAPGCATSSTADAACLSTMLSIGQDMYTPDLARPPQTYPRWREDRPYAALLYLGAEGRRITARSLRTYLLSVGVTGAPALGSVAQGIVHAISPRYTTKAQGWETQVGFEPALLLGVRQSVLAARWAPSGHGIVDLVPTAAISAGNIRTAAEVGGRARLGINLSHPWDPRSRRGRPDWEFEVSVAGKREYVAHDFSLDGTLLRSPERSVSRVPTVSEYAIGTAVRLHRLSFGYRAITRSREYATGPSRHVYSEMYSALEFNP